MPQIGKVSACYLLMVILACHSDSESTRTTIDENECQLRTRTWAAAIIVAQRLAFRDFIYSNSNDADGSYKELSQPSDCCPRRHVVELWILPAEQTTYTPYQIYFE